MMMTEQQQQQEGPRPGQQVIEVLLPTYAMKPSEKEKFYPSQVKEICDSVMIRELEGREYDENAAKDWICVVADSIKAEIHQKLTIPRYKIIVQVTIGQRKDQGVSIASRCLWDVHYDNYASVHFTNTTLWANAMVFGVYTD